MKIETTSEIHFLGMFLVEKYICFGPSYGVIWLLQLKLVELFNSALRQIWLRLRSYANSGSGYGLPLILALAQKPCYTLPSKE